MVRGEQDQTSYQEAGVDIDAASRALDRIKVRAHATFPGSGAVAPLGHFGGVYRLSAGGERVLVASADGIGTKIKLASLLGEAAHARVGADLVNHCVNDILACGASPLFFLDYVAMGRLEEETIVALVGGMADACAENGAALIGGETAEMPGLYREGDYDAAGFIVGDVAADRLVDGSAIRDGDVLLGWPSGGLQTNGYSLVRRLLELNDTKVDDRERLEAAMPNTDVTWAEALMTPHASFRAAIQPLLTEKIVRGMAHITGGGLVDNVPRMLPKGLIAELDSTSWSRPPVFDALIDRGVARAEAYRTFNMGIGFVVAVAPEDAPAARTFAPDAVEIGRVARQADAGTPRVVGLL